MEEKLNTNVEENYLPSGLQFYADYQASEILRKIYSESKKIKHFVPEYDGMKMLENLLPIEKALEEGKESELYQITNEAYKIVKKSLFSEGVRGFWEGGIIGEPIQRPDLDFYDTRREIFYSIDLLPHKG